MAIHENICVDEKTLDRMMVCFTTKRAMFIENKIHSSKSPCTKLYKEYYAKVKNKCLNEKARFKILGNIANRSVDCEVVNPVPP